jgi:peptide/nickel transport system substrate-binding protein
MLTTLGALLVAISASQAGFAEKPGGVLRVHALDSPPSLSMHEEVDANPARAAMGIFNNLVMFDQHAKQNSMQSIVPDLAVGWSWSEEGTELTFQLREGVAWHDGKPFTAKDVKCTWDLLTGQSSEKLRLNPRKSWYRNLKEVTTNGDHEVTFHLQRPQPAISLSSLPAFRWFIPAMWRQMRCVSIRSAPVRSNLSNSSPTNGSR